jgi:cytochrome c biogenesis protein CcmG, thiol:disulfide interchange protein DsbE
MRADCLRLLRRLATLAVLSLFLALLAHGLLSKPGNSTIDSDLANGVSPRAPALSQELLVLGRPGGLLHQRIRTAAADGEISLDEVRGSPLVLNFWASWCPSCKQEAPRLEAAWRSARGREILFLGLDVQDVTEDARELIAGFGLSYPMLRDGEGHTLRDWGVGALPETFFIDATGRIVAHTIGAVSRQQLRSGIRAAERDAVAVLERLVH